MRKIFSVPFALLLVASLGPVMSLGLVTAATEVPGTTTWYVSEGGAGAQDGSNWSNAFPAIQEAIDAAGSGNTIMVAVGTYAAFQVIEKNNIHVIGAEGATVTTTNLYTALPVVGNAWVLAAVYDSEDVNIEGINFDGTGVSGKPVVVGIAYVDSTGRIADLTVENVIATSLGAGVAIIGHTRTSAVEMTRAAISNNDNAGIYVCGGSALEAHFNKIAGNAECGLLNDGGKRVDATGNWWGHKSGPRHETNLLGMGDVVVGDADFDPWLEAETVTGKIIGGGIVDAIKEADTEVMVDGTATVTVAKSTGNPGGDPPGNTTALDRYIDVHISSRTEVEEIEIRHYYTDDDVKDYVGDFDETDVRNYLRLRWWNGIEWRLYSDGGANTDSTGEYAGYIWAKVRANTEPSLTDLTGTWNGAFWEGPTNIPDGGICFIATAAYGTDTAKE